MIWIAIVSAACLAQKKSPWATRKKAVDSFLAAWLVRKDVPSALASFHARALTDGFVLDCGCCGDASLSDEDRQNPEAIERKLRTFLERYGGSIRGNALNEILFLKSKERPEDSKELARKIRKRILNQPKRDRYYVVGYKVLWSDIDAVRHFGERYNLRGAFFSLVQFRVLNEDIRYGDDIAVLLLWVNENAQWKIVSVGVPSCQ